MNDDVPKDIKLTILEQELAGIKGQIYRLSYVCEARKISGYSEAEIKPLLAEVEKLLKMRDTFAAKIEEVKGA